MRLSEVWGNAPCFAAATRFVLKGQHRTALWNPFRVRIQTGYQPGAAFIRIRGFSCPRLICASLSGSVAALTSSIDANTFTAQMSARTSLVDEPEESVFQAQIHAGVTPCCTVIAVQHPMRFVLQQA